MRLVAWQPDDLLRRLDDVVGVYGEAMGYRQELLQTRRRVRRPQDVAAALAGSFETELVPPARAGAGWTLDVVVREG